MSYYHPKIFGVLMVITAMINAASFPCLGLLIAKIQIILISYEYNPNWIEERDELLWYFLGLCLIIGFISGVEKAMFAVTGENLTYNVRRDLMRGILFKQVAWFDSESRAPGILTDVLSSDVSALNGMTTEVMATVIEAFCGLLFGLGVACVISWRMACFTILASPVMLIGVVAMSRL